MNGADHPVLVFVALFATSVWVGSLVCLAVVAATARATLEPEARVAFFRSVGRCYGPIGGTALAAMVGTGLALAWPPSGWNDLEVTAVVLAGVLAVVTIIGVRQARAMTRLRQRALATDEASPRISSEVRRGAIGASVLRGLIALATVALLAVAAQIIAD